MADNDDEKTETTLSEARAMELLKMMGMDIVANAPPQFYAAVAILAANGGGDLFSFLSAPFRPEMEQAARKVIVDFMINRFKGGD